MGKFKTKLVTFALVSFMCSGTIAGNANAVGGGATQGDPAALEISNVAQDTSVVECDAVDELIDQLLDQRMELHPDRLMSVDRNDEDSAVQHDRQRVTVEAETVSSIRFHPSSAGDEVIGSTITVNGTGSRVKSALLPAVAEGYRIEVKGGRDAVMRDEEGGEVGRLTMPTVRSSLSGGCGILSGWRLPGP